MDVIVSNNDLILKFQVCVFLFTKDSQNIIHYFSHMSEYEVRMTHSVVPLYVHYFDNHLQPNIRRNICSSFFIRNMFTKF